EAADQGPSPGDPGGRGARHHRPWPGGNPDLGHRRAVRGLARTDPVLLRIQGQAAGRSPDLCERQVLPGAVARAPADAVRTPAARQADRAIGSWPPPRVRTFGRVGALDRDLV